jgi:hypothetical protein
MSLSTAIRNQATDGSRSFAEPVNSAGSGQSTSIRLGAAAEVPTPAADPATAAQKVLDTGKRPFLVDNYEARMEAFAQALPKGDASYRSQLMNEILNRDPNALNSWMTSDRADLLQRQGQISADQRALIGQ